LNTEGCEELVEIAPQALKSEYTGEKDLSVLGERLHHGRELEDCGDQVVEEDSRARRLPLNLTWYLVSITRSPYTGASGWGLKTYCLVDLAHRALNGGEVVLGRGENSQLLHSVELVQCS
jgi:hypothetical protein